MKKNSIGIYYVLLTLILSSTITSNLFAQAPSNDECSGAITITPNSQLYCPNGTPGTTAGATQSTTIGQPDCSFGNIDDDVWYKFIAASDKHIVSVSGGSPMYYPSFEGYSGTCGNLTSLGVCTSGATAGTSAIFTNLNIGSTYYIRVYSYTTNPGYRGAFNICLTSIPNDECNGALSLNINGSCVPTFGDTRHATQSNNSGEPLCTSHTGWNDDDLWFKFTTPSNPASSYVVDVDANPFTLGYRLTNPNMSFYTGTCGNLSLLSSSCTTPISGCPYRQVVSLSGLSANTTYYIRVYSWVNPPSYRGQFNICVSTGTGGGGVGTLSVNPASLGFGNLCIGDSSSRSFTVSGSNLSGGSISVGPLNGYTFSTDNINFFSSLSLSSCGGSFSQTIYVRFKPSLIQSYNGNITIAGAGAGPVTVATTGAGTGGNIASQPVVAASSASVCPGGAVTLSIQSGSLNGASGWQWYRGSCGGISVGNGTSISVTPSGSTTYYARGEGGTCVQAGSCDSISITVSNLIASVSPSSAQITCVNSNITLNATGGVSYTWSTGATTSSITVNSANTYTVTVIGSGNCSSTAAAIVTQNITAPTVGISPASTGITCLNPAVTLTATGGGSYAWSTGDTTSSISVNTGGTYTVTVKDVANGCTATASSSVSKLPGVNVSVSQVNTSCGNNNGSADASGSSGNGALTFQWSTGATSPVITNLASGNYSVTVRDAASCSGTATVNIAPSGTGTVNLSVDKDTICAQDSAYICAPQGFVSYSWNTGDTSRCIYARTEGQYITTVTDIGNCNIISDSKKISVLPVPSVPIIVRGDTLSSYGGISYQWLLNGNVIPGATSSIYIASQSGSYQLQLTDLKGCTATSTELQVNIKATGIVEISANKIIVLPNPVVNGSMNIIVSENYIGADLKIIDAGGRMIFQSIIQNLQTKLELPVAQGIYFLYVAGRDNRTTIRVAKL